MSVIIKGMDMPESCAVCEYGMTFSNNNDYLCNRFSIEENIIPYINHGLKRPDYCPLVELPEKHGRLIDADAFVECLENEFKTGYENDQKSDADMKMLIAKMHELIVTEIYNRPTVLESEE